MVKAPRRSVSLDNRYAVVSGTRLAIKYQALTGLRYLDVVNPSQNASAATVVTDIPVSMTQPSFDITTLFNGLQPVIATLNTEEIDTFTENAATYLSGEGGLKPMLEIPEINRVRIQPARGHRDVDA